MQIFCVPFFLIYFPFSREKTFSYFASFLSYQIKSNNFPINFLLHQLTLPTLRLPGPCGFRPSHDRPADEAGQHGAGVLQHLGPLQHQTDL